MDKKFTVLKREIQIYTCQSHFNTRLKNPRGTLKLDDQHLKNYDCTSSCSSKST